MKKFAGVLLLVVAVLGFRLYKKSSLQKELRAELASACAGEPVCLGAVQAHFEACFESHYSMGGRQRAGGLKQDEFFGCINGRAGTPVFAKNPEAPASPSPRKQAE